MTPKQLSQFLSVCRTGSMSAAAQQLNIAQPALSKQIGPLEHELGVSLFQRHSRGVTLTKPGARLREEAAEFIRRMENIKLSIREEENEISGSVEIGVISSLAPTIAAELYPRIERDFPNISLKIVDHTSSRAIEALNNQDVDLSIVPYSAKDLANAESLPLFEESFYFVSQMSIGATNAPIHLVDALHMPLVLPVVSHDLRQRVEDMAHNTGAEVNVKYETSSINVIGRLVEEGLASSIAPISFWQDKLRQGLMVARPIIEPNMTRVHSLGWNAEQKLSPAVLVVKERLKMEIATMIARGKLSGRSIG